MTSSAGPRAVSLCRAIFCALLVLLASLGCHRQRFDKVPGETDLTVEKVTLQAPGGGPLELNYDTLLIRLGMRAGNILFTTRYYSPFREAEDRRRVVAWWQSFGYFDVEVAEPAVAIDKAKGTVKVTWTVKEGPRYAISDVHIVGAPEGHTDELRALVPFGPGEHAIDLETFRKVRHAMGERLRREGWGHATVYSRSFVDRTKKRIDWYYYVDAGPKTRVGTVTVQGNRKIPADLIQQRIGLAPGKPYDLESKEMAELALLDTGAFASAYIETDADVEFLIPGDAPDTGGVIDDGRIDAEGNLVPRKLPEEINLTVHVVEAPSQQLRVHAGFELDPTRIDTALGSELWLRNFFAPQHHLTLEGRIGYGWLWRGDTDDPTGLYGEALARYVHPMWIGRLVDLRLTTRYRDDLYPGFHLREITAGPGIRTTIARNLYFDTDVFFRYGLAVNYGPFDPPTRARLSIPDSDTSYGGDLELGLVWDARNHPIEPTKGTMLALRTSLAPGEPLSTHRWLGVSPEARQLFALGDSFSVGLRASASWVFLGGDDGVPLGPRLFGGGAWGMRGYGRQQLSPRARTCKTDVGAAAPHCQDRPVGGLSLFEGGAELRFLPVRKPYGAALFGDVGGAGAEYNPFEDGVSFAFGLGLRIRLWYLPISLDFAYRLVDHGSIESPTSLDPFLVFFRIGEAF